MTTTTKIKEHLISQNKQILIKRKTNKSIAINLNDIYKTNVSEIEIIRSKYDDFYISRYEIIGKLSNKKIKFLSNNSTMNIWMSEWKRRRRRRRNDE